MTTKKTIATLALAGVLVIGGAGYAVTQQSQGDNQTSQTASSLSTKKTNLAVTTSYPTSAKTGDASGKVAAKGTVNLSKMTTSGEGVKVSGKTVTISKGGTYYFTGTATDAQIIVDAGDKDAVTIIMNGVDLTASQGAAIYEKNADKTVIETAANSVNLIDGGTIADTDEVKGAIYATHDLTFKGDGTLAVNGDAKDAVYTKDDLKIKSGTLFAKAANDGLVGHDSVHITDGTVNVTAKDDAIESNQDNDETKGLVEIKGGDITVATGTESGNHGISAERKLVISGGKVKVTSSYEGLQANEIDLNGGDTTISSTDDAVNASGSYTTPILNITAGKLAFLAGGDGLDSNGDVKISGGTINAMINSSPDNEAVDLDGTMTFTGGTLLYGGTGTGATFDGAYVKLPNGVKTGDAVKVSDESGKVIATFTANADGDTVAVAATGITAGNSYQVSVAGTTTAVTAGSGLTEGMAGGPMGGMPQ
ncbi:hypothetical protein B9D04_01360 [Weissella cibaria]|uniref:Carbohydrate-binding domain-containing protein n=1 Tax=Weissella cibaria TaxID=137591 RepID=A0A1X4JNR9_9LACO|nr:MULTISPECIES: carbohydrate-binding domain-containing protein [Weissella]APS26647.1 hypothetical protein AUC63_00590 [Weissella cibaria]APU62044.1 hypothetical protein AUC65_00195 [Weissella cibaria]APU64195.1 hypothetical protein AUC62_00188 [Weissella cibaria]ASS52422.1 Carbohydrate-binding domain-containing protein [Weissella cibaria]KXU06348.1 hypothetical protein WEIDD23_01131 [Weissella sp. DD23]